MRRVFISDDRGQRVALCREEDLGAGADDGVRECVREATVFRLGRFVPIITSIATVFIVLTVRDCSSGRSTRTALLTRIAAQGVGLLIAGGLVTAVAWVYTVRRGARLAREACVAASICPSCGYTLAGLPLEADGCTVCPECAAAWQPVVDAAARGR